MNISAHSIAAGAVACAALSLAGCHDTKTATVPNTGIPAVAGEYTGAFQDTGGTPQTVTTSTLSQHLTAIGGGIVLPAGIESVSWTIDTSGGIAGSGAMDVGLAKCLYSMTARFDPALNQITGSYAAVSNCTGQTGTFTLTQQCTDAPAADRRRPLSAPRPC